jgi:cell division protein FtsB
VGEDMINGIILLILVGFLFPLTAMMYLDILEAKHEVKAQIQKIERLRREIEKEKRDASTDRSQ